MAAECAEAWKDPEIPRRQYELAVKPELEAWKRGAPSRPFDALIRCLRQLPDIARMLDVGASSGYYREVIRHAGYPIKYTGIDFSPEFQRLAQRLYPDIDFDCGDARALPYHDEYWPLVLNGACIMHIPEYERVINETARVSSQYIIFHRTPIVFDHPTRFFVKEGYGCPMLEIHFNETELLGLFHSAGLKVTYSTDVFNQGNFAHRSYLLRKECPLAHQSV